MCGMRVCEWTQQELTLDIRFMGGDYDPGRSGRNREKDSKAKANGRDKRWRERGRENGAKAMKWNEVFDLPRTGQVLPVECLIWCRADERVDTTSCTKHKIWLHILELETVAECDLYIYLSHRRPFSVPCISLLIFFPFLFKFFEQHFLNLT